MNDNDYLMERVLERMDIVETLDLLLRDYDHEVVLEALRDLIVDSKQSFKDYIGEDYD